MEYLSVSQVAEELQVSYQKVLYMIKTGKLPAEKEGKAFNIPANYREVMAEGQRKRVSKKAAAKGKPGRPKKEQSKGKVSLVDNLAKAVQDLVQFQVVAVLGKGR